MTLEGSQRRLIVIVPAYNESESIGETVRSLRKTAIELSDMGMETQVLVIDDGSQDDTAEQAENAEADMVVSHRTNRGLGAAVRTGLSLARDHGADLAIKFDADLQHDPRDIHSLIEPILSGEADIVYGNRFERIEYRMPLVRRIGNRAFTALMRWLTKWPLRDSQPGILAVNRIYLEEFRLPGNYNYTQQILLDAYHKGLRFAHVSVSFRERATGTSFVSLAYPFRVLAQIFWVTVALRPMKVFGTLGSLFLTTAIGIVAWDVSHWVLNIYSEPILHANATLGFGLFGVQTIFFGVLAELINQWNRS